MKKLSSILMGTIFLLSLAFAADYVGVKKCKMCHKGKKRGEVYEKWEKGPHAKAFESIKAKGEEKNPECLKCHATAFEMGGYKVGDSSAANFEGVQCETCHGPGSDYKKLSIMKDKKKAMEMGLIEPTEAVCKKCHGINEHTGKFNFQEAWQKINHNFEKK